MIRSRFPRRRSITVLECPREQGSCGPGNAARANAEQTLIELGSEDEGVFAGGGFGGVGERSDDGIAFVPVRELI